MVEDFPVKVLMSLSRIKFSCDFKVGNVTVPGTLDKPVIKRVVWISKDELGRRFG